MIPGKKYTPEDVLEIAWRRKWFIAVPFIIVTLSVIFVARWLPNQYRSDTLILVVPQRVPESYVRSTVTTRIEDRLQSISQQILSRTRLERIVQDLDLYAEMRRTEVMEDVIERMRKDIMVEIVKGDAFRVSYVSDDRRRAMQVTERLTSLFIDENLRDREVLAEGTNQFLETQLEDARRRLIDYEKKLEVYRRQHSGELPNQVDANLQAMSGTQMQLQAIVDSLNRDRDRRLILERMLEDLEGQASAASGSGAAPTPTPTTMGTVEQPAAAGASNMAQLAAARQLLASLEMRLKPAHPDIARMKRLIVELEGKVEADTTGIELSAPSSPAAAESARRGRSIREEMEGINRQIAAKEAEQKRLTALIGDYQRRIEALPTVESELTELSRDYTTLQTMYTGLLGKNEEAKISANLERRQIGEQFKVLDPARMPERPFSPDRMRLGFLGALAGLALGVGLAALLEYRDTTLKTDEDVMTALALPVLALVPVMHSAIEMRRLKRRKLLVSMTSIATVVLTAVAAFFIWKMTL